MHPQSPDHPAVLARLRLDDGYVEISTATDFFVFTPKLLFSVPGTASEQTKRLCSDHRLDILSLKSSIQKGNALLTIEGYADRLSVQAGERIGFHISTNAATYAIEIARVGAEREAVWSQADLPGHHYPTPDNASSHGCNWPVALRLSIPAEWQSGYYSVILRGSDADGRNAIGELSFVVRSAHPGRDTSILLQLTTNTDCAYNSWGGSTLYSGPDGPARRLSFERPFAGFRLDEGLLLFSIETAFAQSLNDGAISDRLRREFSAHGFPLSAHACMTI